jgi:ribose-phosphate pyrophosphokinase
MPDDICLPGRIAGPPHAVAGSTPDGGTRANVADKSKMMIFAGNANPQLAQDVVNNLNIPLGKAVVGRFSDGEVQVEILENVRGRDVFILQSTGAPTNDNLMELLIMVDALRRASAGRITTVIPYFGYARQDRRVRSARVPISARVVANMLEAVGTDRVLTVDVHADQVQGFFNRPVDNVYASPILLGDIWRQKHPNLIVVSPDVGGVVRARAMAKRLDDAELAIIDKRRPKANESRVMHIIGDVEGKSCVIIDDLVDTAGTLCEAARALKEHGAEKVMAYATHPVLSGPAIVNIEKSALDELVVTDTIPLRPDAQACRKIRQLTVAGMLAETIRRINREESVSSLFID